jgi:hypothetical protein
VVRAVSARDLEINLKRSQASLRGVHTLASA